MKWINAEQQVTVIIYDEEHEEHRDKIMTVEEMLDAYTNEGCPTIYANPEPKTGKWIVHTEIENAYGGIYIECSECGESYVVQHLDAEMFCRTCGSKNGV